MSQGGKLIDIDGNIKNPFLKLLYGIIKYPLEKFLYVDEVNAAYDRLRASPSGNFFDRAMHALGFTYAIDPKELEKIPKTGPLVVVSNHPLGAFDGIIMGWMLSHVRSDAKVIANSLLAHMTEIKPYLIEVNPFGGKAATVSNMAAMKDTIKLLKHGGCVGTFPSGTVSYLHLRDCCISDPEWNTNIANIARRTQANILPIYFDARNSWLFYIMGLIHPLLRTVMLPREMIRCARKNRIKVHIGSLISARSIAEFKTDAELTSWLRINSYILGGRSERGERRDMQEVHLIKSGLAKLFPAMQPQMQELILPINPELMEAEIARLPADACMIDGDKSKVYCAEAWQIKWTLVEIGRLRELTFREVGEGTGKSIDNDEFDQYYLHMFMWDVPNRKIIGAYRIGRSDKILNSLGVQGLYVSTLFNIQREFIDRISPALEMGRSFIAPEYQRKRSTLAILWRGIGEYLHRHPQYKTLYGPVSISANYNSISKDLMVQFLSEKKTSEELSKFVKAKKPPKARLNNTEKRALLSSANSIDHISALVSEVEIDNKGIPTLLKHYLKLDGELLAFNVDNDFGNCIDGLILVDLLKVDLRIMAQYMGKSQAIEYRKFHGFDTPEADGKPDSAEAE